MDSHIHHGGDVNALARMTGCKPEEILDFSVNLNPLGPPPGAFEVCFRSLDMLSRYPEPHATSLVEKIATKLARPAEEILAGNGSTELLGILPKAIAPKRALIVTPNYLEYEPYCKRAGIPVAEFRLTPENHFKLDTFQLAKSLQVGDLVILSNPNNPSGQFTPRAELQTLIETHPECSFLIDEAFIDFVSEAESLAFTRLPNLFVTHSLTKFSALPGLRMGWITGPASSIQEVRHYQEVWSMSTPAIELAKFLLDLPSEWINQVRQETTRLREQFSKQLATIPGLEVFPSVANYLLIRSDRDDLPESLLKEHRIAVRSCADYPGLGSNYLRLAVRPEKEQAKLLQALAPKTCFLPRKLKPALMLQGTCSNAGKSVLAAAFCRILLQDGYRIAPFKAQNMSLNSYVTRDGGEIGRAQAVQAEACRLFPDVRMNPILLKPESDHKSQIILKGQPIGRMNVKEFYANKQNFWETVKSCYDDLASTYDAIVLEGAGSPGEVNLKSQDLVNMNMATYADATVLLVGDIDRGGVYASFLGTYATLTYSERRLMQGFIVNKFRGDASLLNSAHEYLEKATGKPVLGVIDWLSDLKIPAEDSVDFGFSKPAPKQGKTLDVALIMLDHIGNFTDFESFELEPDIIVRKVWEVSELGNPDILIMPGSKSTLADFESLVRRGFPPLLKQLVERGCFFIGICGGLQIAGSELLDPDGIESSTPRAELLGLLDLVTVMRTPKRICHTLAEGNWGYEIHHGVTESYDPSITVRHTSDGRSVGFEKGRIFTSYLHGIFDDDAFRRRFLDRVRQAKGWAPLGGITAHYGAEEALNRLADHVRSRVDLPAIYRMMGLR